MKRVVGYIATAVIAVLLSFGMLLMGFKLGTDFEEKEIDKENNKVQNNYLRINNHLFLISPVLFVLT